MRRSFFWRLFVSYVVAFFFVGTLAATVLATAIRTQMTSKREKEFMNEAQYIATMCPKGVLGDKLSTAIVQELKSTAWRFQAIIWLVSDGGAMYVVSPQNGFEQQIISDEQVEEIFSLYQEVKAKGKLLQKGNFPYFTEPVIMVAQSFRDAEGKQGAVFIHMPQREFALLNNQSLSAWIASIHWIMAVSVAAGVIISLALALYITRPVKQMTSVVRELSRGHFEQRVTFTRRDELGVLADGINAMAEDLAKLDRARSSFVAAVSHELRSPLTSIRGFVQAVRDGVVTDEEKDEYLDIVLSESQRLGRLIESLLDLARIESGAFPLEKADITAGAVFKPVVDALGVRAQEKQVSLVVDPQGMEIALVADSERMQQVVYNLVDNAIRYSPEGGTITLAAHREHEGVILSVSDEGPGISADMQGQMFNDFATDNTARTPGSGMGLGLSIARRIVLQHGGTIRAANRAQGGCEVTVFLPLAK
nr:HAMP domain-containing sensor histidine kinase [bacterium]